MDERRALLAVVLIFLVLFGFNYYYGKKLGEQQPAIPEQSAEERPGDASTGAAPAGRTVSAASQAPEVLGEALGRDVLEELTTVVESPLWVARFSNRGAAILSWQLKKYEAFAGGLVDLVPEGARGLAGELRYGGTLISLDDWTFDQTAPAHIVLDEGAAPAVLRYEARGSSGVRVVKEYTLDPRTYEIGLAIRVEGFVEPGAEGEIGLGWPGVAPTEDKENDRSIASVVMVDGKAVRTTVASLRKERRQFAGDIRWTTSQSRYFVVALVPREGAIERVEAFADSGGRAAAFTAAMPLGGDPASARFSVYAGPQDYQLVSEVGAGLERAVDLGWSLTRPLSVLMLRALVWAHSVIPNYGVIIIIFSVLTKLLFYRLTHRSFTEMKRMQELQPQLEELKRKYGKNREELAQAQMRLYKQAGVNPLGSCLPMLLQMPVFIALYQVLRTTIELRSAPFALWITDLSQPDTIATIAGFPIHVLPLLMGVGMLVQQRFSSSDPSQAAMGKMMPILFTALFYGFASGLVLYWLVNTVLSVVQQYYIHRKPSTVVETTYDAAAPARVPSEAGTSPSQSALLPEEEAVVVEDPPAAVADKKRRSGGRRRKKKRRRK